VRAGKILYAGISDAPAWVVSRANTIAELRGWTAFIGLQIEYSLIQRAPERELLPMARELDIGITAWAPLASGVLTGKYSDPAINEPKRIQDAKLDARKARIVDTVQAVAAEIGHSAAQVAINWVRQQRGVIPIIGARTLKQAKDNLDSLQFKLTAEDMKRLSDASQIELGFPHDFFARDMVRGFVYGGMRELIDNHRG
jgi:aryl-alcohol dehydrogenase-like predicted oxidoreductase